jgi:hypothetical protein
MFSRKPSVLIDMDPPTLPPTRATSPARASPSPIGDKALQNEREDAKKAMGSLFKTAKHDVQVPEFDMNSFGF